MRRVSAGAELLCRAVYRGSRERISSERLHNAQPHAGCPYRTGRSERRRLDECTDVYQALRMPWRTAQHACRPRGGTDEPKQHAHARRLARAIGTEETIDLAPAYSETYSVHSHDVRTVP